MVKQGLRSLGLYSFFVVASLVFINLLLVAPTASGAGNQEFLGLEQIEKGMEGVGKTVVKGKEISSFSIKVIQVIDKPGELEDFIVIRASGAPIEESGGVAQGMSGSPVYIDGKLIGALSRSALWSKDSSNPIALVTPIKTMLRLFEQAESGKIMESKDERKSSMESSLEKVFPGRSVSLGNSDSPGEDRSGAESLVFVRNQTPVMVNGFSKSSFEALKNGISPQANLEKIYDPLDTVGGSSINNLKGGLGQYDLSFHNLQGSAGGSDGGMEIEPGAPMGVALTKGDLSIGALGTVTYREGDRVLGFGHRFLLNGTSNFLLTRASVFDTVKSYRSSFKLGDVGSPVGTIKQDRTQGIMGEIGDRAELFRTDMEISEKGAKGASKLTTDLVKTSDLVGPLAYATIRESINRSLNRTGPGTVKVSYRITGENMPEPIERTDIFFSYRQASFLPSLQVALFIDALAHNPFKEPNLQELSAEVNFDRSINSGQITYFATDGRNYHPGDLLAYQVKIKNYRDDIVKKTGAFQIPSNLPPGNYVVAVYGGPRPAKIAPPQTLETFGDWLGYLNNLKSYEHLSVELLSPFEESVVPMASTGYMYESVTRVDEKFAGKVIYGNQAISINVTEKKTKSSSSPAPEKAKQEDGGTGDGEQKNKE